VTGCTGSNGTVDCLNHGPTPTLPRYEMLPAWRAACIAYRAARRAGERDCIAGWAARDAVMELTSLDAKAAQAEAIRAVAYASQMHSEWLWSGVGDLQSG
jgi:hypothetical protein